MQKQSTKFSETLKLNKHKIVKLTKSYLEKWFNMMLK